MASAPRRSHGSAATCGTTATPAPNMTMLQAVSSLRTRTRVRITAHLLPLSGH